MATVSTDSTYTFTVTGDRSLTAVFEPLAPRYTITVIIDPAGSGSVTGTGQYQDGATVTLVATPSEGYKFSGWQENGQTVSTDITYSFTAVEDRTLVSTFTEKTPSRLPAGYTEVEYVTMQHTGSSTSTLSYVSAGVNSVRTTRCVLDIELGAPSSESTYFGTASGKNSSNQTTRFVHSYTATQIKYQIGMASSASSASVGATPGRHTIDINNTTGILKFDSQSITMVSGGLTALMATNMPYLIYATKYASTKWYSVEIYKSGTLTRQMIPCKNSSGTVGFYDLVSGYFYTLTGTTGTITAGPDV